MYWVGCYFRREKWARNRINKTYYYERSDGDENNTINFKII